MFDHNGLELTPAAETMNAYRLTAVDLKAKKFAGYARAKPRFKDDWSMYRIGYFSDPRDAAYVAQAFEKKFDSVKVRQMVTDGLFDEIAVEFSSSLEIPEWKYQAEGFSVEELINGGYEEYKKNYVDNAKEALVEFFKVTNTKPPTLEVAKKLIADVEKMYKTGKTYRESAKAIMGNFKLG